MNKRTFLKSISSILLASFVLHKSNIAYSQAAMLNEEDPEAAALGYQKEATRVDADKHSSYKLGQRCGSCTWYRGDSQAPYGPCSNFSSDKLVSANGWCVAWMKRVR